jgi:hypothetical protein
MMLDFGPTDFGLLNLKETRMSQQEIKSFEDFWPYYVTEHSQPATRALHAAGTTVATTCAVALLATGRWRLLPLALIPGYAAAWAGHFLIEHNRPATFKYPLWSFIADYKMLAMMLAGKMEDEVEQSKARMKAEG